MLAMVSAVAVSGGAPAQVSTRAVAMPFAADSTGALAANATTGTSEVLGWPTASPTTALGVVTASGSLATGASGSDSSCKASPILLYAQDWNSYASTRSTANWREAAMTHDILVRITEPGIQAT